MIINRISAAQNYNSKITKQSNNPAFGNKKIFQTSTMLGLTTITASALFADAIKEVGDPSEIIKEYFEYENAHYAKKPKIGVNLSRFNQEEKYEILKNTDEIKLAPKTFRKIINAKNSKDEFRFSADESLDLFLNTRNSIQDHSDVFNALLDAKNDENKERFNSKECKELMNYAEEFEAYPNSFKAILATSDLTANECKELILRARQIEPAMKPELLKKVYEENKDVKNSHTKIKNIVITINDVMNMENSAKLEKVRLKDKRKYLKPVGIIEKIYNTNTFNKPLILNNGERVSDEQLADIKKNLERNYHKCKSIIKLKAPDGEFIFNEKDSADILSDINSYILLNMKNVLKATTKDGKRVFSSEECKELINKHNYNNLRDYYAEKFVNIKNADGSERYTGEELVYLIKNINVISKSSRKINIVEMLKENDENGNRKYSPKEFVDYCNLVNKFS